MCAGTGCTVVIFPLYNFELLGYIWKQEISRFVEAIFCIKRFSLYSRSGSKKRRVTFTTYDIFYKRYLFCLNCL